MASIDLLLQFHHHHQQQHYQTVPVPSMESRGRRSSAEFDADALEATELKLGLPGTAAAARGSSKRSLADRNEESCCTARVTDKSCQEASPPVAKTQVVGWPPVRSFRKNAFLPSAAKVAEAAAGGVLVKVSMDGAPYLRKIDLKGYDGYKELLQALNALFKSFSSGDLSAMDNGTKFAVTYEDKDGDWMLVGDVPWEMFVSSCKRLRIMKGKVEV